MSDSYPAGSPESGPPTSGSEFDAPQPGSPESNSPESVPAAPPARRSTYLRSGAVALGVVAVMALLINFFLLQHHSGSTVDGGEISQRISQGIQATNGATEPPQVACPRSLPASEVNFDCTLLQKSGRVVIEVHRTSGTLTWTVTNRPASASSS